MTLREQIQRASVYYNTEHGLLKVIGGDSILSAEEHLYFNQNPHFIAGAEWAYSHVLKPADGDDLPEIDREVIAIVEEFGHYKAVVAHRPPEYWDGKNILTGEVTRYYPKRYDKGGWNQPNVKWWLDCDIPKTKMEE